ncbi:hypothetical protein GCM10027296_45240 [Chitinimonas naiadis]
MHAAAQASADGNWRAATVMWQEAAQRQKALDDWPQAGQALLGYAQAMARQGRPLEASAALQDALTVPFYPSTIKVEVLYQLALLEAEDMRWGPALAFLDQAAPLIESNSALLSAALNLRARAAWQEQDWSRTRALTTQALSVAAIEPAERANALRLQGRAAARMADWPAAEQALNAALELDRQLARSQGLVADLRAQAEMARLRGTPDAAALELRAKSICEAAKLGSC